MNIECMRAQLCEVYPYPRWRQKVACMHESQVVAIWKRLAKRDELYRHEKAEKQAIKEHQITIWEWMKENERTNYYSECKTVF